MDRVQSLTQAYSQAPWRKQMQLIGLFLLILVLTALVAGIYLSVTARAAAVGREILLMQGDIERLKLENADLGTQLAILKSSNQMEQRAMSMGFVTIEKGQTEYLVTPGYFRPDRVTLAPPPAPITVVAASLPPDFTQSLFDWIGQKVALSEAGFLEVLP
jgi:cell division protein FtsL